jgi:hypothetical protein
MSIEFKIVIERSFVRKKQWKYDDLKVGFNIWWRIITITKEVNWIQDCNLEKFSKKNTENMTVQLTCEIR